MSLRDTFLSMRKLSASAVQDYPQELSRLFQNFIEAVKESKTSGDHAGILTILKHKTLDLGTDYN